MKTLKALRREGVTLSNKNKFNSDCFCLTDPGFFVFCEQFLLLSTYSLNTGRKLNKR